MTGRRVTTAVMIVAALVGVALAGFLVGLRRKYPPVVDAVRRFARDVGNPQMLRLAGRPGVDAAVVEHRGRTSGRPYRTPVTARRTDDGFVIALPYGAGTDWVKNVLHAGTATLVSQGARHAVVRPEVVPVDEAAAYFPTRERRMLALVGVEQCLRMRLDGSAPDRDAGRHETF